MKKKIREKVNLKSDKAFFNADKKIFGKTAKRAYIALVILAAVVSVSAYMKNRAEVAEMNKTAFNNEVWQEAIEESGLDEEALPVLNESLPEPETVIAEDIPKVNETAAYEPELSVEPAIETVSESAEPQGFIRPSNGKVVKEFSGDELVYQSSTDDWRTHNGIDFAAAEGEQIFAVSDGVVKKVEKDDMWGITLEIEHSDGVISRYVGLQSMDFIKEGQSVKSGDIIGGVGISGYLEEDGGAHLHFEILKNGDYENPNFYFIK